ncbi:type IV pilus biogenesis/stability protein PilW [Undibacterium sp. RTI2.1]|uniref:type IV pilus biogenesis/stability protein PilW n=1 Tax=unclassified Undibacterium TaxID=2630295 RepID=UPI002AB46D7A|nr:MULTISPECIES: type IV pilus biogenesis/stability protein PilW [unclassified Undibacterium]MDY7538044.1 type IV pilus biogenesis/stability protein PilW [Undibacterium sp. 5I1]MEB0032553.1 type IV pilus biogenesis/stability protein PilW [Undibacterium sp. RTI2.1]MEB0117892.1 type IV pilus biogenesis/stability protein PilW [Undibacterium sp. RTI2.2]MEB0231669.1 type IV pilus biogenesis/stability protein PilW [Undibacterium sp. 10I3]MEB0258680.1 type IV pilus biogenesis/stability protein PilW [
MKIFGLHYRFLSGVVLALMLSACASKKPEGFKPESNPPAESVDLQKRAAIRMELAIGYYQQGQYKVALDEIRQALIMSPDLVDAYSVRALIYMDTGEKQLAEDDFQRALKLTPNNSDIANNYGWFLCQNGKEKQAMTYFDKALKDPTYSNPIKVLNNAGVCSLRLKDTAKAEGYFMQAFRADPSSPTINANLAKIYFDRGEYEKAKFYINRVLKADVFAADVLWLAIKIENKLGDQSAVNGLGVQLRRRYANSKEYALFQQGAFNE